MGPSKCIMRVSGLEELFSPIWDEPNPAGSLGLSWISSLRELGSLLRRQRPGADYSYTKQRPTYVGKETVIGNGLGLTSCVRGAMLENVWTQARLLCSPCHGSDRASFSSSISSSLRFPSGASRPLSPFLVYFASFCHRGCMYGPLCFG